MKDKHFKIFLIHQVSNMLAVYAVEAIMTQLQVFPNFRQSFWRYSRQSDMILRYNSSVL